MLKLIIKAVDEGRVQDLIDAGLKVNKIEKTSREILDSKLSDPQRKSTNYYNLKYISSAFLKKYLFRLVVSRILGDHVSEEEQDIMNSMSKYMNDGKDSSTLPLGSVIGAFSLDESTIERLTVEAKAAMASITESTSIPSRSFTNTETLTSLKDSEITEPPYVEPTSKGLGNLEVEEFDGIVDSSSEDSKFGFDITGDDDNEEPLPEFSGVVI